MKTAINNSSTNTSATLSFSKRERRRNSATDCHRQALVKAWSRWKEWFISHSTAPPWCLPHICMLLKRWGNELLKRGRDMKCMTTTQSTVGRRHSSNRCMSDVFSQWDAHMMGHTRYSGCRLHPKCPGKHYIDVAFGVKRYLKRCPAPHAFVWERLF